MKQNLVPTETAGLPWWTITQEEFATLHKEGGEEIKLWFVCGSAGECWGGFESASEAADYLLKELNKRGMR